MEEETPAPPPPSSDKPSQAPSWAMVGFLLGALFVLALPHHETEEPAAAVPPPPSLAEPPGKKVPLTPPRISTIEAVFDAYGQDAVWDHDTTQVALWNSESDSFADCFEVLRTPEGYFFRSIPKLTHPVLTHGVKPDSPLRFTETADQRAEWLGEKNEEDWRALQDTIKNQTSHDSH
ncbi:MAG: hypothetical protein ABSA05_01120 [Opitutaceae bacterium]|jgi:hypothetical protein